MFPRRTMIATAVALVTAAGVAGADTAAQMRVPADDLRQLSAQPSFNRIATFANYRNNSDIGDETVSEIVAVTGDGQTLVYTDAETASLGTVDITDPSNPQPLGTTPLGGDPTSVATLGNRYALVAVVTDDTFTAPQGELRVVDIPTGRLVGTGVDLGGQPDAIAVSPDQRYVAVVIENERDEEICVGGSEDAQPVPEDDDAAIDACEQGGGQVGVIPQNGPDTAIGNPPGFLVVFDVQGADPTRWTRRVVELTGLADFAPTDPEPEFVDINPRNQAAVSLQENNHMVIVDLPSATVIQHFPLGAVSLANIDATEDDRIDLSESLLNLVREPDAVAWVPADDDYAIATANEGDMFGGSRGFSIFYPNGLSLDSGNSFEHLAVQHGHYPENRSENKGSEPEAIEYGRYGDDDYLFVGSERGSFIAVYQLSDDGWPQFKQLLPAPLGPEGVLAVPQRNLLIVSGEVDDPTYGVRSTIMFYQLQDAPANYPQLVSADGPNGTPIPFSAISGMTAVPGQPNTILAVSDSYYADASILRIDVSAEPAIVREATTITGGSGDFDLEGIAVAPDGAIWVASEGDDPGRRSNRLLKVNDDGEVLAEVGLPADIEACRAASTDTGNLDNGFEGVAVLPGRGDRYRLLVAQQLPWTYTNNVGGINCRALDDAPGFTRLWIYDPQADAWSSVPYELAPTPEVASWVGLSEITALPSGRDFVVIERDNRTGDFATRKTLVKFSVADAADGVSARDKRIFDVIPRLEANNGWISDKPEGVAILGNGAIYLSTDNDGVDDWSGETWFLKLRGAQR